MKSKKNINKNDKTTHSGKRAKKNILKKPNPLSISILMYYIVCLTLSVKKRKKKLNIPKSEIVSL